jgi:hypothetical protein
MRLHCQDSNLFNINNNNTITITITITVTVITITRVARPRLWAGV